MAQEEEQEHSGFDELIEDDAIVGGKGTKGVNSEIENLKDNLNR